MTTPVAPLPEEMNEAELRVWADKAQDGHVIGLDRSAVVALLDIIAAERRGRESATMSASGVAAELHAIKQHIDYFREVRTLSHGVEHVDLVPVTHGELAAEKRVAVLGAALREAALALPVLHTMLAAAGLTMSAASAKAMTNRTDAVERVARAIALSEASVNRQNLPSWPREYSKGEVAAHRVQAYAAIVAHTAALAEEGLVSVPRKPSREQALRIRWSGSTEEVIRKWISVVDAIAEAAAPGRSEPT